MLIADAIGGIWQPAHEVVSTQGRLWACLRPQSAHRPTPISSDALLAEMGCRFCGPRHRRSGCDYDSPCYDWLIDSLVECLELPFLSAGDQKWIMGRRMCEWFGWPLPQQEDELARLDLCSAAAAGLFVPADPPAATPDQLATVPISLWLRKAMSLA